MHEAREARISQLSVCTASGTSSTDDDCIGSTFPSDVQIVDVYAVLVAVSRREEITVYIYSNAASETMTSRDCGQGNWWKKIHFF
jgi:hypothetical protein